MPNVAIVLSGAYRTLPDCNASVVTHVINSNPSMKFHVYAHLTTESLSQAEHEKAERAVWATFPCVAGVLFETNSAVSAAVRKDLPAIDQLPRGSGTARGKAMNIVKMFRGIGKAQQLLEAGSTRSCAASTSFRQYDLVLRLRPDLCFCGPLELAPLVGSAGRHLWLPWWSSKVEWAFDQIAIGVPLAMREYASAYETTVKRLVSEQRELYPEAVMMSHLKTLGPPDRKLRALRSFRASLARGQPSFHLIDPYTKLKQDLAPSGIPAAHAAAQGEAALPDYECKDAATTMRDKPVGHAKGHGHAKGREGQGRRRRMRERSQ